MAIKIKNMEMPEACGMCPFSFVRWYLDWAKVSCPINDLVDQTVEWEPEELVDNAFLAAGRDDSCPLEEVNDD
jgi:hypothetical protein